MRPSPSLGTRNPHGFLREAAQYLQAQYCIFLSIKRRPPRNVTTTTPYLPRLYVFFQSCLVILRFDPYLGHRSNPSIHILRWHLLMTVYPVTCSHTDSIDQSRHVGSRALALPVLCILILFTFLIEVYASGPMTLSLEV